MSEDCRPEHDFFTDLLTFGLCVGLIVSYLPQHIRIIHKSTSEGISPWFLLLGSTSTAAGMLNIFIVQWGVIRCCHYVSSWSCLEITAGEYQVGLQWLLFTFILVLYMIYFPQHLKTTPVHSVPGRPNDWKNASMSPDWRFSILVSWITGIHFVCIILVSVILLASYPVPPNTSPHQPLPPVLKSWATFLGVSSAILAAIQYLPQLVRTYRLKLVGALSIPMMCIQTPGAILMVQSIAIRPGTNWTSWITYAVAGLMQGTLLFMCILWKIRQQRLGIDDFGAPLIAPRPSTNSANVSEYEEVPGLVTSQEEEDPKALTRALANALGDAVSTDVRSGGVQRVPDIMVEGRPIESPDMETTPLLNSTSKQRSRWLRWFS